MEKIIFTLLIAVLTQTTPPAAENIPPIVTIEPNFETNKVFSVVDNPLHFFLRAEDPDGSIQTLKFFRGPVQLESYTSNFWVGASLAVGPNDFYAVAHDNQNLAATSATIRVFGTLPPEVQMTQPTNTTTFYSLADSLVVKGTASDSDGVSEMRLIVNGKIVASDFLAPYEFHFQGTTFTNYSLQLEAVDNWGATTRSPARYVEYIRVNDDLDGKIQVLTGNNFYLKGSNLGATFQKGEPQHAGVPGGKSIWFAWRPATPTNGTVVIDTFGSQFDTVLAVYTNRAQGAVSNLTLVASNDNAAEDQPYSRVKFAATYTTTYYIAVDGRDGLAGDVRLNIRLTGANRSNVAPNDFLANALRLTTLLQGSNTGASKEPDEPNHAGNPGGRSLWYRVEGLLANVPHRITTEGSNFDTTLAIYTNVVSGLQVIPTMQNLRLVAANDDTTTGTNRTSEIIFTPPPGPASVYWVAVDGYNGAEGNIRIAVSRVIPSAVPPNDMFVNAMRLYGTAALTNADTSRATQEFNEPRVPTPTPPSPYGVSRSVWYRWIAPSNGPVLLSTRFSNFDTVLGVYTGTAINTLTHIASNDDDPSGLETSALIFNAVAGTEYRILVAGFGSAAGNLVFALNQAAFHLPRIVTQQLPGRIIFTVADAEGTTLIEQSSDLSEWTAVQLISDQQPVELVLDPLLPQQFYRVRSME